jgi:hypothetical protein
MGRAYPLLSHRQAPLQFLKPVQAGVNSPWINRPIQGPDRLGNKSSRIENRRTDIPINTFRRFDAAAREDDY